LNVSHEDACARVAALFPQRWLRHYVSSKLRSDPVFPAVFEIIGATTEPLLDVGCGVGLLPFYLRERRYRAPVVAIDTDSRKVRRAQEVARKHYEHVEFIDGDVRDALPPFSGNVAVLDVVHYLNEAQQTELLSTLAARVSGGGALLLRDAPRDGTVRFWMTRAGEAFAQTISWNLGVPLQFPTRESINAAFPEAEFSRAEQPCWGNTPFNNRLFTFRRRASAAVPRQG
jgi:2-polyprenyl-3-methyl-5-hydroxy-6-metoxy-1,4-benzoquinol methylase